MKQLFFILLFCISAPVVYGQSNAHTGTDFKIAYFDKDSLLKMMPEYKAANDSAQKMYVRLEEQMIALHEDLQKKLDVLNNNPHDKSVSEKELAQLQINIQEFQAAAEGEYAAYKEKLLAPAIAKVNEAAKKVAKEKGYAFVLDSNKEVAAVIFANESYNIFDDMCKELGIPVPKKK